MPLQLYQWSEEEQEVVTSFGLTWWSMGAVDYRGYVLLAHDADENYYVAKSIKKGSREINALQKMLSLPSPRNRVVPGHLFECHDSYVYLMPRLERVGMGPWASEMSWRAMLDQLYTIIDCVQYMQEHNVAFIDVSLENTVWSRKPVSYGGFDIPKDQLYFIDYGSARTLPAGPGSGVKIHDYDEEGGKFIPTEATDVMDPYAYDVYALGYTFERAMWWYREDHTEGTRSHVPHFWSLLALKLRAADPSQRPSIFRARRLFAALQVWTSCTTWMYKFSERFADGFGSFGWRIISCLVY